MAGEGAEKREPSYTVGRNVNLYNHYGEQYGGSLRKKKKLSYDSMNPFLGMYLGKPSFKKIQALQCSLQHVYSNQAMEAT